MTSTAQYNAWCKNDGKHQTGKRPFADWNAEVIEGMVSDSRDAWDLVERRSSNLFASLASSLATQLDSLGSATYREYTLGSPLQFRSDSHAKHGPHSAHVTNSMAASLKTSVALHIRELKRTLQLELHQFSVRTR